MLTFIYTRCPMPDYCPLMSNNFSKIREDLLTRPESKNNTRLLSITVDPDFDKPAVLREYGLRYAGSDKDAVFKMWEFATGTPEQIKAVAQFFGLNYWPEKGQIIHGLRTAIIAPDGRVFKIYRGNEWKPSEIVEQLGRIK
ncbi:MAG: SCO family protein [Acidobacteria bacterium]|nr:SCO family protein [Acidobacteriota bacterium]